MKPYTYLVGWSKHNMWYYGVRYGSSCHPDDFWVSYFTSSVYVSNARKKYGEPDVLQIRKIFDNPSKARLWEDKVLCRLGVVQKEKFLNRSNNAKNFYNKGGHKLPERTLEHCEKLSKAMKGKSSMSLTEKKKRSLMYTGEGNPNYKKIASAATKQKMKQKQQGRPVVICERVFEYMSDAANFYNTSSAVILYRVKARSERWVEWFYKDTGPVAAINKVRKRPDLALRNKSIESRERSRINAVARWNNK